MILISSPRYQEHSTPPGHPERPERAQLLDDIADDWRDRGGRVVEPRSESDRFIAGFNDMARNDPRVELVILPIADGLTIARRLP